MRKRNVTIVVVVALVAGAAAAWGLRLRAGGLVASTATLSADWYGSYRGHMTLPAVVRWCPVTRVGVLEAVSGDSGVAIVFFERDGLTSGPHPIVAAEGGATAPRPAATMALRWIRAAGDTSLVAMRSASGTAHLTVSNGTASGDATARTHAYNSRDTLVVHATFRGVPVVTTAAGCT